MVASIPQRCPCCNSQEVGKGHNGRHVCQDCSFVVAHSNKIKSDHPADDSGKAASADKKESEKEWRETISARDASEDTLIAIITRLESVVRELGGTASDCVRGAEILTETWEQGYFHGRSIDVGIGAVAYVMFRQHHKPRPLGIVAEICSISPKQLRGGYRSLRVEYNINGDVVDASAYIPFLASQLRLTEAVQKKSKRLIESASEISGSPSGIAVAALYLVANSEDSTITLAEAGKAAGVTKETVWLKTQKLTNDTIE